MVGRCGTEGCNEGAPGPVSTEIPQETPQGQDAAVGEGAFGALSEGRCQKEKPPKLSPEPLALLQGCLRTQLTVFYL